MSVCWSFSNSASCFVWKWGKQTTVGVNGILMRKLRWVAFVRSVNVRAEHHVRRLCVRISLGNRCDWYLIGEVDGTHSVHRYSRMLTRVSDRDWFRSSNWSWNRTKEMKCTHLAYRFTSSLSDVFSSCSCSWICWNEVNCVWKLSRCLTSSFIWWIISNSFWRESFCSWTMVS